MGAPTPISPEIIASGIGAIGSLGSTFLNGMFNRDSMDRQVQASKDLMKYEWDNFKSPRAQVGALASAGINPAVAFGSNSGAIATPTPVMPQSIPPQFDFSSIGSFVKAMADAKKAGLESVAQNLENTFIERTLEDRVKAAALANDFTEEQIVKTQQEVSKIVADQNVLRHEAEIKRIDAEKHKDLLDWQIQRYRDEHNLDKQQFDALKEQLPVILDKLKHEEEILDVDASIAQGYKSSMAQLGVVGDAIKIIMNLVKIFK